MGTLHYGDRRFEFDDRTLSHLQLVISTKLRRSESFFLSWDDAAEHGGERTAIWIGGGVPIQLSYQPARGEVINRDWLDELLKSAVRSGGLLLSDEPGVQPPAAVPVPVPATAARTTATIRSRASRPTRVGSSG